MHLKRMFLIVFLFPLGLSAQPYKEKLLQYREGYKESLLGGSHPLSVSDTQYLCFYDIDADYCVKATFELVTRYRPFQMNTKHGGKKVPVREYGLVHFNLKGAALTLTVYRLLSGQDDNSDENIRLFIPFNDRTNYKETFEGGRYVDVSAQDVINDELFLDFNKCYNPHTAYEKGYPYIIPPPVNSLRIEIKAGEKVFGHNPGY